VHVRGSLNAVDPYSNLLARADAIGFKVSKVVFRGYITSIQLQEMHDDAINKRTDLVLQKETQEQEQDLKDFKLDRDSQRAERLADFKLKRAQERQAVEKEKVEHDEQIQGLVSKSKLQRELQVHQQALGREDNLHAQRLRHQSEDHARLEHHYSAIRQLDVDLSRYLVAVSRGAPHRVIEVDSGKSCVSPAAHLHVHSEDS